MQDIQRICVSCKKVDFGNGIWMHCAGQLDSLPKESLCPECCRKRFPQFYSDYQRPAKRGIGKLLSSMWNLF